MLLKGSALLFFVTLLIVVFLAADEYVKMVDNRTIPTSERLVLNLLISIPFITTCLRPEITSLSFGLILAVAGLTTYLLYRYKDLDDAYSLYARFVFGAVYIGFLGSHLALMRVLPEGALWLIIASAITASSDTGAYFVGRAMGKKKLCPNVSPNKTVEGAVGGVISGTLAAVIFAMMLLPSVNYFFIIISAILLSGIGIFGDLTESIIKRGTNTKDSGQCLAGHGGILDRVDSLLFVGPPFYYLLVFWI